MRKKKRHLDKKQNGTINRYESQMGGHNPINPKKSLGKLRETQKTKPRSPDATGTLCFQRHSLVAIVKELDKTGGEEVICNIAGWKNRDHLGPYLTVEISPRFVPHDQRVVRASIFDEMFDDQDE
jgi:hypothetical protein